MGIESARVLPAEFRKTRIWDSLSRQAKQPITRIDNTVLPGSRGTACPERRLSAFGVASYELPRPTKNTPSRINPRPANFWRVSGSLKNRRDHTSVQIYPSDTIG